MVVKTIQDYYSQLSKEFPEIPISDIKRICLYGLKSLYLNNSVGADVHLLRNNFWIYFGRLMNDSIKFFEYYKKKTRIKLRALYRRNKIEWDGYYYFGLTLKLYNEYISSKNKKGRPKKNFTFSKIMLYKIYDECSIMESSTVALFRIPFMVPFGFVKFYEELNTSKAELLLIRNPLKLKDILKTNYKYLFYGTAIYNESSEYFRSRACNGFH